MSEMIGMDVEAVRRTASELRRKASEIRAVEARVDAIVGQINGVWPGARAHRFVGEWHGHHRPALHALAERIDGLGQSARNNAREQEEASASGHGRDGRGGGHHGGGGGGGFWEHGVGGFLHGAWDEVAGTVGGVWDIASLAWDADKRQEYAQAIAYAFAHPGEALSALGSDLIDLEDWRQGRYAQALGHMAIAVPSLLVAPLKLTKISKLHKLEEAGGAANRARIAESAAKDSLRAVEQRAAGHPRWRTGEVEWHPTGAAPGRWADPDEFRAKVVDPARADLTREQLRALAREHDVAQAQRSYGRWSTAEQWGERTDVGYRRLEKVADADANANAWVDEMNRRRESPNRGGGGSW